MTARRWAVPTLRDCTSIFDVWPRRLASHERKTVGGAHPTRLTHQQAEITGTNPTTHWLVSTRPSVAGINAPRDSEAIRPGQPNTVVVCVSNETLNELGTGGIMGPVMFYLPGAGKVAKLENPKPLGKVFPEY